MLTFTAPIVTGMGRGKGLGYPTLNLDLASVPEELQDGVHVCTVDMHNEQYPAVLFHGNRPVFGDPPACEVHLLDIEIEETPELVTVSLVEHLRAVEDFGSPEKLKEQIARDIEDARGILGLS